MIICSVFTDLKLLGTGRKKVFYRAHPCEFLTERPDGLFIWYLVTGFKTQKALKTSSINNLIFSSMMFGVGNDLINKGIGNQSISVQNKDFQPFIWKIFRYQSVHHPYILFFFYFCTMKVALKQICLWFLTFSLILIIAGFNHIGSAFSNQHLIIVCECSGLEDNSGHAYDICFEDEVVITEFVLKSTIFIGYKELVTSMDVDFNNHYTATIWQPPKSV